MENKFTWIVRGRFKQMAHQLGTCACLCQCLHTQLLQTSHSWCWPGPQRWAYHVEPLQTQCSLGPTSERGNSQSYCRKSPMVSPVPEDQRKWNHILTDPKGTWRQNANWANFHLVTVWGFRSSQMGCQIHSFTICLITTIHRLRKYNTINSD